MDCGVALKGIAVFCRACWAKRKPVLDAMLAREKASPRPMEVDPYVDPWTYPEPDYARVLCLDAGCPWFAEGNDEDGLKFRAETHRLDTGHRVGYFWHTDDLRDTGDEPDEVIG
jgi:hypothetical protein